MYIDTHSHIYENEFLEDRAEVVERAREAGVGKIVLPDIDSESRGRMLDTAAAYPGMMFPLAEKAIAENDYKDVAYFEPFYLKEFVAGKPKKLL